MQYVWVLLLFAACKSESQEMSLSYQPFSTSVIEVSFEAIPSDTVYLEARTMNNIPKEMRESEVIIATDNDHYCLNLINDRPSTASLKLNQETYNVIIFPDDTVRVSVKFAGANTKLRFTGKGAEINRYYQAKKKSSGYVDTRIPLNRALTSSASYESISQATDSLTGNELDFLERYLVDHVLPEWFINYEKSEIKYLGLGFKTQMPKYNELFNLFKDDLPDSYYDFLKDVPINNPTAIFSSYYLWFLDDYFIKDLSTKDFKDLAGFEKISKIHQYSLPQSKTRLSGEVKDVYHQYMFSRLVQQLSDASLVDSLAKVYEVQDYQTLLDKLGNQTKGKLVTLDMVKGDTIPDFFTADLKDSLVSFREYEDKIVYINFWASWCKPCIKNIPALNDMIQSYSKQDNLVFLNISVDDDKRKWRTAVERYQLSGINLVAEGRRSEKLRTFFNIRGIPNYVLVEPENVLYESHTGKAPAVKSKIDELLKKHNTPMNAALVR